MRRSFHRNRSARSTRRLQFEVLHDRTLCAADLGIPVFDAAAIQSADEATQLGLTVNRSAMYVTFASPIVVAPQATLTTDALDFDGGVLNVRMVAGGTPTDEIRIRSQAAAAGQIGADNTTVTYGDLPIGTYTVHAPVVGTRHVYKVADGRELALHVVAPENADPNKPAIVLFHGGGWRLGTPASLNHPAQYLASRGMVAILVEYRFVDAFGREPPVDSIHDAKSAMRWVRASAAELGVDPNRIAAGGYSAGGHLAAFTGMVDGMDDPADDLSVSAKANALVLLSPTINNGPGQYGYNRVGDQYVQFSPAHNVSADDPPTIAFIGTDDIHIPRQVVVDVTDELSGLGVPAQTHVFNGLGHEATVYRWNNPAYYTTWRKADEFLASLGWLQGPPTLEMPDTPPAAELKELTITLGSNATPEAVQALLRNITFRNTVSGVFPEVRFELTDGHGLTAAANTRIIRPSGPAFTTTWHEGAPPVLLWSDASLPDEDSTSYAGGRIFARIGNGSQVTDRLTVQSSGNLTAANGEIHYSGELVATYAGGGGSGAFAIHFNSNATALHVKETLRSIAFSNPTLSVVARTRAMFAQAYRPGNILVLQLFKAVQVTVPVNAAPSLSPASGDTVDYQRGAESIALLANATVTDPDSPSFVRGRLLVRIISGGHPGNRLVIGGGFTLFGNLVQLNGETIGARNSDGGVGTTRLEITFSSKATRGIVEDLVRAIRFQTEGTTSLLQRRIEFSLTDDKGAVSNKVIATVNVSA